MKPQPELPEGERPDTFLQAQAARQLDLQAEMECKSCFGVYFPRGYLGPDPKVNAIVRGVSDPFARQLCFDVVHALLNRGLPPPGPALGRFKGYPSTITRSTPELQGKAPVLGIFPAHLLFG